MVESPRGGVPVRADAAPSVAHDLRSPLAVVATNLDFALGELGEGRAGDDVLGALRDARAAVERLAAVVERAFPPPRSETEARPVPSAGVLAAPHLAAGAATAIARILIVDDEPAIGVALRRNLGDHEVSFTTNGLEALARLTQGERFDVILCDLTMPGIGGDELYGMVMAVAPEQAKRIVFISGGATTARAQAFIDTVPNLVLRKPFDTSKLRQLIRARLGARRM